ncbi:hypothetical protein AcV5_002142 [Taiwanofungus camphoratus]|nr:hypothetical protein AcV5_002142 [Antrodia cinnamomea]
MDSQPKTSTNKRPVEDSASTARRVKPKMTFDLAHISEASDLTDEQHRELDEQIYKKLGGQHRTVDSPRILCAIVIFDQRLLRDLAFIDEAEAFIQEHNNLDELIQSAWRSGSLKEIRQLAILHPEPIDLDALLQKTSLERVTANLDLTDDQHRDQDAKVYRALGRPQDDRPAYTVIEMIVAYDSRLNQVYQNSLEALKLCESHQGLKELVEAAWRSGSLKIIRQLKIVQGVQTWSSGLSLEDQREAAMMAWETPFVGGAHRLLVRTIQTMNAGRKDTAYANYVPIIQSSGTGKSRTVHEAAGLIFTLPLNVRAQDGKSEFAYPPPDNKVRDYLTGKRDERETLTACLAFFKWLFAKTAMFLQAQEEVKDGETLALSWRNLLDRDGHAVRDNLYSKVVADAEAELTEVLKTKDPYGILSKEACDEATKLVELIKSRTRRHFEATEVILMIYLDEAHTLSDQGIKNNNTGLNCFDVFCKALTHLTNVAQLFVVTLSTKSNLSKHAPSKSAHRSNRVVNDEAALQAPFVELSFDCLVDNRPIVVPGTLTLDDFSQVEFMAKMGRPLWHATWRSGNTTVRSTIIHYARAKLTGRIDIPQLHKDVGLVLRGRFSTLSTRLLLEVGPSRDSARQLENQLVEGNMRIAYSVPVHREYLRSGSPSEPILAEAAAQEMAVIAESEADAAAKLLTGYTQDGLVNKGDRGELVMRLLLTLAYDDAVRKCCARDGILPFYSRRVPVVDFLEALISDGFIENVLDSKADNDGGDKTLREAFKDAYVRFTHFAQNGSNNPIDCVSAYACIARGMALQVHHNHKSIDAMIPIAMSDTLLDDTSMSCILVQVKDKEGRNVIDINEKQINNDDAPFFLASDGRPYITIDMQLGLQTEAYKKQFTEQPPALMKPKKPPPSPSKITTKTRSSRRGKSDHPRYVIHIYGCSPSVYKVVQSKDVYAHLLDSRGFFAEHPRQTPEALSAVRRFKPEFDRNTDCYDWILESRLHYRFDDTDKVEDVVTS